MVLIGKDVSNVLRYWLPIVETLGEQSCDDRDDIDLGRGKFNQHVTSTVGNSL